MTVLSRCPDPRQLQQLLLGRLVDETAQRLEEHVGHCPHCSRLIPTLQAEDPLVEAMRGRPRGGLQPSDTRVLEGLIPRLYELGQAGPASGSRASKHPQPITLDFLRPAQTPDEIGRLGPYRVLKLLGQGGMGLVFLAEDVHLRRTVALKVMRPEAARKASARQRFLREARATAAIEHDHIVTIYQVGEDHGVPFLAMQLLRGMSLEDFLRKKDGPGPGTPLNLERILKLGREIARGLEAAHERGLIHRDIKPGNIWLDSTAGGRVKILDFGLAHVEDEEGRLTRLGTLIGTPTFMAPEQSRCGRIDGRADLFSLGCVLYRLCTGRLPFKGSDALDTLVAVARDDPTPVQDLNPTLPPRLAGLVMQLLAKKPEDRPASARVVVETLQAIERSRPPALVSITPPAAWHAPQQPGRLITRHPLLHGSRRRHDLLKLAALVSIAGLLCALAVLFLRTTSATPTPDTTAEKAPGPGAPAASRPARLLSNSIHMKLAYIPPGKFFMGSTAQEIERFRTERFGGYALPGWEKDEGPRHEVRITRGFYMGIHEVTQQQYQAVMGDNPSANKESPEHPVEQVRWWDAVEFCKRLSNLPGEKNAGRTYRLPTEAEWEYACRAGTTTAFHQGDSLSSRQANFDANLPFGTAEKGPRIGKTVKVGSYPGNAFGLYDMHGNVWEWCADGMRRYTPAAVDDPRGPETPEGNHVMRGGGWNVGACRSAYRKERDPRYCLPNLGFRVVCVIVRQPAGGKAARQ